MWRRADVLLYLDVAVRQVVFLLRGQLHPFGLRPSLDVVLEGLLQVFKMLAPVLFPSVLRLELVVADVRV